MADPDDTRSGKQSGSPLPSRGTATVKAVTQCRRRACARSRPRAGRYRPSGSRVYDDAGNEMESLPTPVATDQPACVSSETTEVTFASR